jgi:hypothetical protein
MVTALGMFPKYLRGMAMPRSARYDIPSILPINLKFLMGFMPD